MGFARPLVVSSLALALLASAAHAQVAPPPPGAPATDGTITNVAGTDPGFAGDFGPATQAKLNQPGGVTFLGDGSLVIADRLNNRIRTIEPDGTIFTAYGNADTADNCADVQDELAGSPYSRDPDGSITAPTGVVAAGAGLLLVTQGTNCLQQTVGNLNRRVAGNVDGAPGLAGDGGPAREARLRNPTDAAYMPDGSLLIADTGNHRIRRVDAGGIITTFAGTSQGFGGDGGPANQAQLSDPRDVAVFPDGTVLIADTGNDRIRKVTPEGVISTVAGGGGEGLAGDGDPATTAQLNGPTSVVTYNNGGFLFTDSNNDRVRRVTPLGAIFTVAGTTGGLGGDGALAKNAQLNNPTAIALKPGGGFVVADTDNARIRAVSDVGAVPGAILRRSMNLDSVGGVVNVTPTGSGQTLPLLEEDLVPLGSQIDARLGTALVNVQRGTGVLEPARAFEGMFTAAQGTAADPITTLTMTEPISCGRRSARSFKSVATVSKKKKRKKFKRRLWVDSKGKYRIKGRYVSALERGTKWRVRDACDRSEVYVEEGAVKIRDLVRNKTRIVEAPATIVVRARRR